MTGSTTLPARDWAGSPFASAAARIRRVLFGAMSLSSAGIIAIATVSSIAGAELGDSPAWAGVPTAMTLFGAALAAPVWGISADRLGRRTSLALGLAVGAVGAAIGLASILANSLYPFLGGMALVGVTSAAVQLSRFSAGEVHPPRLRARAISTVVLGGAVGSVAGPMLVAPSGRVAVSVGAADLVGPFGAAAGLFLIGVVLVALALRPEPQVIGLAIAEAYPTDAATGRSARPVMEILRGRGARLAVVAMALGQVVMLVVMVMTSLHMRHHQHALESISLVIASHTFGMYAFSVVSGRLADRVGRVPVIAFGAAMLALACVAATISSDVVPLAVALFLLGLGWNFCYVGGSSLLTDQLLPAERARTQGFNDLLVSAASAVGSLGSGLVFAELGFAPMAFVGAALALIPLAMAIGQRRSIPAPMG